MSPSEIAQNWRQASRYVGRGGVVVIFKGEVQGWVNELRNPEHWQPGCIAVDENGKTWGTVMGDERQGALMWLANHEL